MRRRGLHKLWSVGRLTADWMDWMMDPKIWLFFSSFFLFFSIFSFYLLFLFHQTKFARVQYKKKGRNDSIPIYCCNIISLGLPKVSIAHVVRVTPNLLLTRMSSSPFPFPFPIHPLPDHYPPYFFYDFGSLIVFSPDNTTHLSPSLSAQQKRSRLSSQILLFPVCLLDYTTV